MRKRERERATLTLTLTLTLNPLPSSPLFPSGGDGTQAGVAAGETAEANKERAHKFAGPARPKRPSSPEDHPRARRRGDGCCSRDMTTAAFLRQDEYR